MNTTLVRRVIPTLLAGPFLLLAGCAGMDDFARGFNKGVENQQRYNGTPAQREAYRVADLPRKPAPLSNPPGPRFYRCTSNNMTVDYKVYGGEWYVKPWLAHMWNPLACNKGEVNTGMGTSTSTCGMTNGYDYATVTFNNRWSTGLNMTSYYLDPAEKVLKSTTWINSKKTDFTATCKTIGE